MRIECRGFHQTREVFHRSCAIHRAYPACHCCLRYELRQSLRISFRRSSRLKPVSLDLFAERPRRYDGTAADDRVQLSDDDGGGRTERPERGCNHECGNEEGGIKDVVKGRAR